MTNSNSLSESFERTTMLVSSGVYSPGCDKITHDLELAAVLFSLKIWRHYMKIVKDVHRFARLGVRLEDSPNGGFMVHHNSK